MAFLLFCAGKVPTTSVMYREMVQSSRMPGDFERAINNKTWAQERLDMALAVFDSQERDVIWSLCALDQFAETTPRKKKMITGLAKLSGAWGFKPN